MDEPRRLTDAELARQTAISQAVSTAVYVAMMLLISTAIVKRDHVSRAWTRLTRRPMSAEEAREARLLAELRRDVSRIEHGDDGHTTRRRGLYER